MLVLTRRIGEEIVIDQQIRIVVTAVQRGRVRLSIDAPADVRIARHELLARRDRADAGDSAGRAERV